MLESGKVIKTDGGRATVMFKRTTACGKCHACGMLKDMSEIEIDVKNSLDAAPGDIVVLESQNDHILKFSLIGYGIPLLCMVIGICLGYYVFSGWFSGLNKEITAVISGVILTAVGYLIIKLCDPSIKKLTKDEFKMVDVTKEGNNELCDRNE